MGLKVEGCEGLATPCPKRRADLMKSVTASLLNDVTCALNKGVVEFGEAHLE